MAEEDQTTEVGEEGEGAEKGGSKMLLIIIIAVVLIGGAGAGAFFMLGGEDAAEEGAQQEEVAATAETAEDGSDPNAAAADQVQAFFFEVPELLVNLASAGASNRYLKMKVNLELASEADAAAIERVMPRIVNDFQLYLRQLRVEDLQGAAGVYRLREALLLRANQAAQPLQVNDVLFKEILVQ